MDSKALNKNAAITTIIIIAMAAIMLAMALATAGCTSNEPETGEVGETVVDNTDTWSETSTPVLVHYVNDEADIDLYHAITAENNGEIITMLPGEYTVSTTMPVNADGTTFKPVEDGTFTLGAGEAQKGTITLNELTDKPLTAEELDAYLTAFKAAADNGDDSFTDEMVSSVESTIEAIKADLAAKAEAEAKAAAEAKAEAEAAAAAEAEASQVTADSGYNGSYDSYNSYGYDDSGYGSATGEYATWQDYANSQKTPSTNTARNCGYCGARNSVVGGECTVCGTIYTALGPATPHD